METSRITTMGRTWTGESWTTLYGSVVGTGLLLSQRAGMPRPPEKWGAVSRISQALRTPNVIVRTTCANMRGL